MYGLNNQQPLCGNEEVHWFHHHERIDTRTCSGYALTPCREYVQTHPEHTYDVEVREWCEGVCMCVNSQGKHDHGPGRHK